MRTEMLKFRVTNFRSVRDSGWIETGRITSLVGTNESGKTNLLIPLWKLKPANGEPIVPLIDYPRKEFIDYDDGKADEVFVSAEFILSDTDADHLMKKTGFSKDAVKRVIVSRKFNGKYKVEFPNMGDPTVYPSRDVIDKLDDLRRKASEIAYNYKTYSSFKDDFISLLSETVDKIRNIEYLNSEHIIEIQQDFKQFNPEHIPKTAADLSSLLNNVLDYIDSLLTQVERKPPADDKTIVDLVISMIPNFVYYADYGNLDSEIYLPHVINNLERPDLGEKERAKVRTLKVLFDFVKLDPKEILQLGQENINSPDPQRIKLESENKKKREILLQSASTKLTRDFKQWWKQGDYKFRFDADGNHFRIWVSDEKRPEEIELEGRSRGLQWFFSFFLVFLVESSDGHYESILLLDEPGLSLHPLAQYDLINFFNTLSESNQLLYTTHSPFLVNSNHLEQVRAVFVDEEGFTSVSTDLRANTSIASKSIYPVNAALGLTVSDTLLIGSKPILVEGPSDQIYLNLIKMYLLSCQLITLNKELVFIPAGGVKGISTLVSLVQGRDEILPVIILDSDKQGQEKEKNLKKEKYVGLEELIVTMKDICGMDLAEVEDLMPGEVMAKVFSRMYRTSDEYFDDVYNVNQPIIPQIEGFARRNDVILPQGWKVDFARQIANYFDKNDIKLTDETVQRWKKLFDRIVLTQI